MTLTAEQIQSLEVIKAALERYKRLTGDNTPVTDKEVLTYALDYTSMSLRFGEMVYS